MTPLQRTLALAGLALLPGLVTASERPPEAAAAANPAAAAVNDFATRLYGQLAREHAGENLFFSPFSLSAALAMTAEGARGETALQMGRVLGLPAALRREGERPWDLAPLHAGMGELLDRFNREPAPKAVRERVAALRAELDAANRRVDEFYRAEKYAEGNRASAAARKTAAELNRLLATVDQYELRVANALWAERTYPFEKSYLETVRAHYRTGGAFPVDFAHDAEGVRKHINDWAGGQTRGRVKGLVPPGSVDELTRLVLANAVYFQGEWAVPFDPKATAGQDFRLADGTTARVPLMSASALRRARYAAFEGDRSPFDTPALTTGREGEKLYPGPEGFTALELPYKGDELAMLVLLPRSAGGLPALERSLNTAPRWEWPGELPRREVHVRLPRFRLEAEYRLKPALKALGMARAFADPTLRRGAQFDGMSASRDPDHRLRVSDVQHKAFVEVTEKGTEAAAATEVIIEKKAEEEGVPFTPVFQADHPFLFLIRDRKTGVILFLGRVLNPKG